MELYPVARLAAVAEATARNGLDALLLTPGPDLRYVTGYDATQLERLTCLVVPAEGDPSAYDAHENIALDRLDVLRAKARAEGLW